MATNLIVWMNGRRVGVWSQSRGSSSFQYDSSWAGAKDRRRLSLSLDFQPGNAPHKGAVVENYFDNLLPDSDAIRKRLQSRFGAESQGAFDLLGAIGRDCVGAVQLLPEDEEPGDFKKVQADPLDEAGVERELAAAISGDRVIGSGAEAEFRLSIAGAQEKTALLRHKDKWCRPRGPTPTTHIFKLPLGVVGNLQVDLKDSVENEWLCLKLMAAFALDAARAEIGQFGRQKALIVERFDRVWQETKWIARRPQEDFCQALGVPGWKKYETQGGPGMDAILGVLSFSAEAVRNRRDFVKIQLLFWLLAATDGHAKNFSLFHEVGGVYRLTPIYDVLSVWPVIGPGPNHVPWQKATLAMTVKGKNSHRKLKDIQPRHWSAVAKSAGLVDPDGLIHEVLSQVPKALSQVDKQLPKDFPDRVRDKIFAGIEQQAKVLSAG